jgi:hypothetical protein
MVQNGAKWSAIWSQMEPNGPNQPEMAGKVLKSSKEDRIHLKQPKTVLNGLQRLLAGPKLPLLDSK